MEDNKIYFTPESAIILQELKQKKLLKPRLLSQDNPKINLKTIKIPQRSRQISLTKELDYYVKQSMKEKMKEKQKQLNEELECFKYQYKDILQDNPYVNNKLKKNFFNLKFSDEQRETYAIRLGRLAVKHNQQIKQMQRIVDDIHKKYEAQNEQLNSYMPKTIETMVTESDSYIKTSKIYNPDLLAKYQQLKYQHFWNKLPKTLAN
ncbi:unnamed protein product (macronuclear) [Paramecium tetraurelia]|uniref:Uncharacterized protein n=1 Tax=Paramecium tetraurelia TaxID=5888 RepID=A0D4M7_PARTE|nr:uncharacterized protein GSPATT00013441001 [Paramecium tetraurelia]CAK77994.1 unnamed protein product [Paramecium tetraurelia]|eukprot:XP_001445391.1 hypothetical protein (macronuclear) [Paramecium tetraurelia strain d4-2]